CRGRVRVDPVFDPAASLRAAGGRGDGAGAVPRGAGDVLSDRPEFGGDQRLPGCRGGDASAARALRAEGDPRLGPGALGGLAAMSLLEARGLTRHFDGVRAVEAVDFDLEAGEIHALIGPNGAGKTTFVSLLSGRIAAQAG